MGIVRLGGGALGALAMATACLCMAAFGTTGQARAQAASGAQPPLVQSIIVTGNQRIEAETVASYLIIQPGQRADQKLLDVSLKTLFNTGLFSDVKLEMQPGGVLNVQVKENPIVNRVIFEGNKRVKEDKFTDEIQLTARGIFTRAKVASDVQRIVEIYRRKGRFAATVTPKVTPLAQNRVDVIYEIDEGPKTGVAKINFIGNKVFTDNELRGVVLTNESRWWRFFSSNDNFDPDRLEYDQELLRKFYTRNGYADFQVVSAVAELTPDRKEFFITFTVDEGPQYTVGDVKVKTTLAKLDESVLERFVPIKSGQTFDGEKVDKAVESITFATGSTGYAFVDVNPKLSPHPESKKIDITFEVNEGPRVYVERINIKGNTQTLDKVIRREIRLTEGDAFNRVLVDRSRARIRSLGFFKDVKIDEKPGSAPDRTELDVTVEEQSTGSFSVGVGVSSTENFIIDFSIEQRNLMGRGQALRFQVQASSRTRSVDIRFTQPYFLDRNLAAGFSIFNQRTNFRESGFVRNRLGLGLNAGFQVSEFGRGGLQYLITYDDVSIDTVSSQILTAGTDPTSLIIPGADFTVLDSLDLLGNPVKVIRANLCDFVLQRLTPTCASEGKFLTSLVGYSLSFDRRDDPIDPTRGWRASFAQSLAGAGGDVNYWRSEFAGAYYHPLFGGFIGALKLRAGYIDGYAGDDVRLSDRFFQGGDTFRGFEVAGVGPRFLSPQTTRTGRPLSQAIGGKAYAVGSAEILLPLPLPKEYGIKTSLFTDFGTVGLVDNNTKAINDDLSFWVDPDGDGIFDKPVQDDLAIRATAGVSISWDSPFGPVRFDIAKAIKQEFYDRTEGFRFSAGTSF